MDEQEKRETTEAEKQYSEAGKKHAEAERLYAEAEKQFADAVRASYQAVADRSISAQALNAQLTQQFLNSVINNLRGQAEDNRAMTQELVDQQRRTQEAGQALTQESVGVYMDFVNSIFSFYQRSVPRQPKEASGRPTEAMEENELRVRRRAVASR
jgi:light-regulated signal transduction histidine kinase (bacteriophytochrome)